MADASPTTAIATAEPVDMVNLVREWITIDADIDQMSDEEYYDAAPGEAARARCTKIEELVLRNKASSLEELQAQAVLAWAREYDYL